MDKTLTDNDLTSWRIQGGNCLLLSLRFESHVKLETETLYHEEMEGKMEQTDGNVTHTCAQTDPCISESKTSQTILEVEDADVQVQPSMCHIKNETENMLIKRISRSSQTFKHTRSNGNQYSVL